MCPDWNSNWQPFGTQDYTQLSHTGQGSSMHLEVVFLSHLMVLVGCNVMDSQVGTRTLVSVFGFLLLSVWGSLSEKETIVGSSHQNMSQHDIFDMI